MARQQKTRPQHTTPHYIMNSSVAMYDGTLARANQQTDKGMTRNWLAQRTETFSGLLRMMIVRLARHPPEGSERIESSPASASLCHALPCPNHDSGDDGIAAGWPASDSGIGRISAAQSQCGLVPHLSESGTSLLPVRVSPASRFYAAVMDRFLCTTILEDECMIWPKYISTSMLYTIQSPLAEPGPTREPPPLRLVSNVYTLRLLRETHRYYSARG